MTVIHYRAILFRRCPMADGKEQQSIATPERERTGSSVFWPDDLDRFMGQFFGRPMRGFWRMRPLVRSREEWLPEMDVFEQEGKIVMRVDLPGMKREDINVAVEGDMLVVRGQRKEKKEVEEDNYHCAERAVGAFYRSIRLPEGAKTDTIMATYKDGVLEVSIPHPAAPEPKKLKVEVK
jgi:HSP20 family protein